MTEDYQRHCHIASLPTEVLTCIFKYLPAKQLQKCRQVCSYWKQIIDDVVYIEVLWRSYCKCDYTNIYKTARNKSRKGLLWYHIYRSLTLWSRLSSARETKDEFASASTIAEEVRNLCVLSNGVIGVHKRSGIFYYDIETMEPCKRDPIIGDYVHYSENEHAIVILGYGLHLYVIRKTVKHPSFESNLMIDNVKIFLLIDRELYYVSMNNDIFLCSLTSDNLKSTVIARFEDDVMTLGYKFKNLHVLTSERNIYTFNGKELLLACVIESSSNIIYELRQYNLLDNVEWRVIFNWMFILNHIIPQWPLQDMITTRSYGDMLFIGTNWGVMRIYQTTSARDFDLFEAHPVKQYNFMERSDCPVLSTCPIIDIDIIEGENGHTLLVAMPKKIAVIDFVYNFKSIAPLAITPHIDMQNEKILEMTETLM